jgi:ABC-type Mn2+/Zn2+ transport system permease subunit
MSALSYFWGPQASLQPALLSALAVALLCGALSPLVVLRRMAFVGQGISHAAFGGVGVAALLGLFSANTTTAALLGAWGVVALFCIGAALAIAALSRTEGVAEDTAIGILLVASMALGFLLLQIQRERAGALAVSVEGFLFGQVATTGVAEAWLAWGVLGITVLTLVLLRRPLLFWAFDEGSAASMGVRTHLVQSIFLVVVAVAVVITMQLAGVILSTAMLVLPGATALQLSRKSAVVWGLSFATGVTGALVGLFASVLLDAQPGPAIALAYVVLFGGARLGQRVWGSASGAAYLARRDIGRPRPSARDRPQHLAKASVPEDVPFVQAMDPPDVTDGP